MSGGSKTQPFTSTNLEDLLARARERIKDNNLLQVVIHHDSLNHTVVVPLLVEGDMSFDKMMTKVESVLQSKENLAINDSLQGKPCTLFF